MAAFHLRVAPLVAAIALAACTGPRLEPAPPEATPSDRAADPRPVRVRAATAAGSFYPADAAELERLVTRALEAAPKISELPVKIVLAPHAGLRFSGAIAADSFKQLQPGIRRVVMLAANHSNELDYDGIAVDQVTDYQMPGFRLHVAPLVSELVKLPGFIDEPRAHQMHMIEMELPFLRAIEGDRIQIVPLIIGNLAPGEARRRAATLANLADEKTLFVFSVDLSHFHPYAEARALDERCLAALVSTRADPISRCDTDGTRVLEMMNELAADLALTPRLIRYQNSGDVTGEKTAVVGYGSLVYEDRFELGKDEGRELVDLARRALEKRIRDRSAPTSPSANQRRWPRIGARRSAFVTLEKSGELRGCFGTLVPIEPLADNVVRNAVNAATADNRFDPVKPSELSEIALSVSVLDIPRPLDPAPESALLARLAAKKPGVILEYDGRRSTFLPQMWEKIPEANLFLEELCAKLGSEPGCWKSDKARFQTYTAQRFEEPRR